MSEEILLEPSQEELLVTLVEAWRNWPQDTIEPFEVWQFRGDGIMKTAVHHPGLPTGHMDVYFGHLDVLRREGLLSLRPESSDMSILDILPRGFAYYDHLQQYRGAAVQRVETAIHTYLDAEGFQQRYPSAYGNWIEAEHLLWAGDLDEAALRRIGHFCREATQQFATVLVDRYQPPDASPDKAHDQQRIRAVLQQQKSKLSTREHEFLDALLAYWKAVSNLIQRQVHGSQKPGTTLNKEDGRRVVFQTAIVMFEIDRSLPRNGAD